MASALTVAVGGALTLGAAAQRATTDGPVYEGDRLVRPADYREWPFLGAGLGMTYDPGSAGIQGEQPQLFTNVFVNPASYRAFMASGQWPDKTVFILEARSSSRDEELASVEQPGVYQTGLVGLEANVKDSRFPNGWGFFRFPAQGAAERLTGEAEAPCVTCHTEHTAVELTFVQFYPTLLEVARQKGTLKPGF